MRSSPTRRRSALRSRRTWGASSRRTAARSSAPPPLAQELAAPPEGAQLLDVRPVAAHLAGHRPGAISVPVSGTSFSTKAGFVLDAEQPVCVLAETFDEAQRAIRGLHAVAFFDIAGFVLGGGDERTEAVTVDELDALIAAGAEVIDVREKDDRDTGYIPGSRNVPYRLMATCCPDLPTDRPVVTICDTGPAGRDRRQHPPHPRLRRPPRRRRRHDRLARPRRRHGRVQALRLGVSSADVPQQRLAAREVRGRADALVERDRSAQPGRLSARQLGREQPHHRGVRMRPVRLEQSRPPPPGDRRRSAQHASTHGLSKAALPR